MVGCKKKYVFEQSIINRNLNLI